MLQKKRNVFFSGFFLFFLFQWLLETLTWETSNQKWQCPTDQGQALFRAMQMWKFTCFAVVAARQKQQEESEEAGNLWNLLVFRPWDLFKICLRFRWKSLTGEVKPCALSIEDGFSEDLEEWVQLYSDSDHLVKESDIYVTSVLVVYPEIQASCSYLKCTSRAARGGGGSFKNRKRIGEIGCCESRMTKRKHWWIWQTAELSNWLTD